MNVSQVISDRSPIAKFLSLVGRIGREPTDSDQVRLRKVLLVSSILFLAIPPSTLLGVIYFIFEEPVAGSLLFVFTILSFFIVILLGLIPRFYPVSLFCELLLVLLIPFLVTVSLGGFDLSLAIVWSFMCPLGALMMTERKIAQRWFIAYLSLFGLLFILQPYLRPVNNLPPLISLITAVLNLTGALIVTFVLLNYFVAQRDLFQKKADDLLLNILPIEIAAILKEDNQTIADHFDNVSILFADIVGFTTISARVTPIELVEMLNEIFSRFDTLVEEFGLEKIKTIGDAYMVASGIPTPREDHAEALVLFALAMRETLVDYNRVANTNLQLRIGINSGPVVAGVIGKHRFIYDLWGDSVNTASRMESHGEPDKIQLTEATRRLLDHRFNFVDRSIIDVKGKGPMQTYFLQDANGLD